MSCPTLPQHQTSNPIFAYAFKPEETPHRSTTTTTHLTLLNLFNRHLLKSFTSTSLPALPTGTLHITLLTHNNIGKLASQLNIIVSKLSELCIIHAQCLFILRCSETESRNEVHEEENDTGAEERISEARHAVCELVGELDPVMVEPTAGNLAKAVEMGYVIAVQGC